MKTGSNEVDVPKGEQKQAMEWRETGYRRKKKRDVYNVRGAVEGVEIYKSCGRGYGEIHGGVAEDKHGGMESVGEGKKTRPTRARLTCMDGRSLQWQGVFGWEEFRRVTEGYGIGGRMTTA